MARRNHPSPSRGRRRPLSIVGKSSASLSGQTISYTIKRSPRARYARLEVRPETGLTVVIPRFYQVEQVPELLERKSRWILNQLAKYSQAQTLPRQREVQNGDTIPYLGRDLEVIIRQDHRKADTVRLERNKLAVSLRPTSCRLDGLLEGWYRLQAEKLMRKRADEVCPRLGVTYSRLTIRGARTRWGSCSHKGNLSFNWKLLMAPLPVIDYVIIHELAHRREMNHSKRFWKLVAEYCPRWREHRKWLKDHEAYLAAKLAPLGAS